MENNKINLSEWLKPIRRTENYLVDVRHKTGEWEKNLNVDEVSILYGDETDFSITFDNDEKYGTVINICLCAERERVHERKETKYINTNVHGKEREL